MYYGNFDLNRELENVSRRVKEYFDKVEQQRRQSSAGSTASARASSATPMVADVYAMAEGLAIDIELPGVKKEDISVKLIGESAIEVAGQRAAESGTERTVIRQERWYGSFRRVFQLPKELELDFDKIQAAFREGVLHITIAKREPEVQRPIDIQ